MALGDEVFDAAVIGQSPLLGRARSNVFVTSTWAALAPHLRLALGMAWHQGELEREPFSFRVVTDEQILRASLGRDKDPELYDGAVAGVGLLVVRLGFLGWKNHAAAGYLHEALLRCIDVDRRPVWLTDTPSTPFEKGHLSWSDHVSKYVMEHFEKVTL
jgi:hypothetical protein